MMNHRILALFTFHLSLLPCFAQMDNVVDVESTYTPTVSDADKTQPTINYNDNWRLRVPQAQYSTQLQPSSTYIFTPMPTASSDAADTGAPRRFLSLGGGNAGRLNLRGAYGLQLTDDDRLDLSLSLRGYSAKVQDAWDNTRKLPIRYYSTRGAASYEHRFAPLTSLLVSGDIESQVLNGQHNTLFNVQSAIYNLQFNDFSIGGTAGFDTFSQKYCRNTFLGSEKNRETHFNAGLNTAYRLDDDGRAGLDLSADFYTYAYSTFHSAHTFDLHPYYTFHTDELQLTLGARLDFFNGIERKFRAAPDAEIRYHISDALTLFGQASGGTVQNSYRHYASLTPYWIYAPFFLGRSNTPQLSHQFDYVRTTAGIECNPTAGLFARLYGGFTKSTGRAELLAGNSLVQANGWQWLAHLDIDYTYRDLFRWKFNGQYNVWHSNYGNNDDSNAEAVAWRPIIDISTEARLQPVRRLQFGIDYTLQTFSLRSSLPYHRPVTSDLGASVSYQLPVAVVETAGGRLTAFARGDNLLCRHYDLYPCVRTPGFNFLAGLTLTF